MYSYRLNGFLVVAFLCSTFSAFAQLGCTDPLATNYDPLASTNDGSCTYPMTDYVLEDLGELPNAIRECSGLAWKKNHLWAQNDGGNVPMLFELDTLDGSVLRSIRMATGNWDWEDLAESPDHLFVGDFGNNDGSRQNLSIYRISENQLLQDTIWTVDTITFSFADQTDFTPADLNTPYDCEAFFFWQDSLHVFTKDWVGNQTKHYVFPAEPGDYTVAPRATYNVEGLITGADISPDGVVALLGYGATGSFFWLLFDYEEGDFFSGNKRRINIGTFGDLGQTEGIVFSRAGEGFIASEELFTFPAQLFRFSSWEWTDPITTNIVEPQNLWRISPNPFKDFLQIKNGTRAVMNISLYDGLGKRIGVQEIVGNGELTWDLHSLLPGFYFLRGEKGGEVFSRKLVKQP